MTNIKKFESFSNINETELINIMDRKKILNLLQMLQEK